MTETEWELSGGGGAVWGMLWGGCVGHCGESCTEEVCAWGGRVNYGKAVEGSCGGGVAAQLYGGAV